MVDPLTVIGGVGAISNTVDVASKALSKLGELRTTWKHADLIFLGLVSQLTVLHSALSQVQAWVQSAPEHLHHQLVMDLDVSLACCNLLLTKVDDFIEELGRSTEKPLNVSKKAKVVLGTRGLNEVEKLLGKQTHALTLLLIACNCQTISEQKRLLERPKSRRTLERAVAASISQLGHRDTSSLVSRWTDNLSGLSKTFTFDRDIFATRVYEPFSRASMKESLRSALGTRSTQRKTESSTLHISVIPKEDNGRSGIVVHLPNGAISSAPTLWSIYGVFRPEIEDAG